jgi:transcriptional regulator with GAF, ATPase, and Fis domain
LLAPLILGLVFYILGKMIVKREKKLENIKKEELFKLDALEAMIYSLDNEEDVRIDPEISKKYPAVKRLENFKTNLKKSKEQEANRTWITNGIVLINEILKDFKKDIPTLMTLTLSSLVKYSECHRGAVYVIENVDGEDVLKRVATFAIDKENEKNDVIMPGEGMVGQAFIDKEYHIFTNLPEDFMKIHSGLGELNAQSLMVIPLVFHSKVYGVVELAKLSNFSAVQEEFLVKVCENIASTLGNRLLKVTTKVGKLK